MSNLPRKDPASFASSLDAQECFFSEIVENRKVLAIRDEGGFPTSTVNGKPAMPFWSSKKRSEAVTAESANCQDFEPYEIALQSFCDNWVLGLERDNIKLGINWSRPGAMGYDLTLQQVSHEINGRLGS